MTKRKLIWLLSTIATFIVVFYLIPDNIANMAPTFIPIIGAALTAFFWMQAISDFKSYEDFNKPRNADWKYMFSIFSSVFGVIILFFVFSMNFSFRESDELKKDGIRTVGIITDGSGIKIRKGASYDVTVQFLTNEGDSITVTKDIGESDFGLVSQYQPVELIYSRKDPKMIRLLISDVTRKEFESVGASKANE